jgi:hypothetical protein
VFTPARRRFMILLFGAVVPFVSSCRSEAGRLPSADKKTFVAVAELLEALVKSEVDGIPDAILNRTRCVVVLPANRDQGVTSCLEKPNQWTRPDAVMFRGERRRDHDLLVLVLGKDEADRFRSRGELAVGKNLTTGPGPLARTKAIVSDADLRFAVLLYSHQGDALHPGSARGDVHAVRIRSAGETSSIDRRLQVALTSFFNVITPAGIIIHHTGKLPTSKEVPRDLTEVDAYHSQRGFDVMCFGHEYHVAYHYLILPDGKVQTGRPERCQGAHARGYNAFLGVSVVGDFSGSQRSKPGRLPVVPTAAQQDALIGLIRRLRKQYDIPIQRIMPHSDVAPTQCPGADFPFLKILQAVGEEK